MDSKTKKKIKIIDGRDDGKTMDNWISRMSDGFWYVRRRVEKFLVMENSGKGFIPDKLIKWRAIDR